VPSSLPDECIMHTSYWVESWGY